MTKVPKPTEKSKRNLTTQKNFDYIAIADRLRTVSWSKNSHPTGVVKPVYERSTFPLTTNLGYHVYYPIFPLHAMTMSYESLV